MHFLVSSTVVLHAGLKGHSTVTQATHVHFFFHAVSLTVFFYTHMQSGRQDEMGTPFRIIASDETLDTGTVFLQDRDTTVGVSVTHSYRQTFVPVMLHPIIMEWNLFLGGDEWP